MKLEGITKKGRERIKRDGADGWTVKCRANSVLFSTESGPWLLVMPACENPNFSRWIHETRDTDFRIVN